MDVSLPPRGPPSYICCITMNPTINLRKPVESMAKTMNPTCSFFATTWKPSLRRCGSRLGTSSTKLISWRLGRSWISAEPDNVLTWRPTSRVWYREIWERERYIYILRISIYISICLFRCWCNTTIYPYICIYQYINAWKALENQEVPEPFLQDARSG